MDKMFFQNSGVNHFMRKNKLRGMLDGKISSTEIGQISHKECELGIWLYSDGLKNFGNAEEMRELEAVHLEIHNICRRIIHLAGQDNKKEAEEEYKKMDEKTKVMVNILSHLSTQIESDEKVEKQKEEQKEKPNREEKKEKKEKKEEQKEDRNTEEKEK